jgi:ABC-type bacteriocin/lantibiotic exporter with double-glycine peptidase domain
VIVVATPSGLRRYLARRRQAHLDAVANYTRVIDALLRALNKVNTVTRPSFLRVNAAATAQVADERRRYGQAKVLTLTVVQAETLLLQCAVFVLAGAMALRGGLTIGQAVACVTYATAFIVPIQELVSSLTTIHSTADVRAGIDALCAEPDEPSAEPPTVAPAAAASVEVSGASIQGLAGSRYSLVPPAGARVLGRGDSGSAKTTLLEGLDQTRHIEGPYSPAGVAAGQATRHWVGLADQHAVILPGSFVDNVTIYGTYPLDRARLEPLLEAVPAFEPLLDLTDCTSLSGGEQQFLVACRLVTLDPPLVLLDEPFSALPLDTGLQLLAMMLRLLHGTILCSSHADASIDDLFDQRVRIEQVRMAEPVG